MHSDDLRRFQQAIYAKTSDAFWVLAESLLPYLSRLVKTAGQANSSPKIWPLHATITQLFTCLRRAKVQTNLTGNVAIKPKRVVIIAAESVCYCTYFHLIIVSLCF